MALVLDLGKSLIRGQRRLSLTLDKMFPKWMQIDGNQDFTRTFVPSYLTSNLTIYDIGGGKTPILSFKSKSQLSIRLIGIDIDQRELDRAPEGSYDRTDCTDICAYSGQEDADLVICQALLEHVTDTERAIAAISSLLKPGGRALVFLPSRNAIFARLNLILPQGLKKRILHAIFPETRDTQGFPAFYDRCTPRDFKDMARRAGLIVDEERVYFRSMYFSFFAPLHLTFRVYQLATAILFGNQAAETFAMSLHKPARQALAA
jgi:SAM-dependent methyltransferase